MNIDRGRIVTYISYKYYTKQKNKLAVTVSHPVYANWYHRGFSKRQCDCSVDIEMIRQASDDTGLGSSCQELSDATTATLDSDDDLEDFQDAYEHFDE